MEANPYDSPQSGSQQEEIVAEKPWWKLTWVEYLVIAAIIGVLIALLLPNVQRTRTIGRWMKSENNLKQIGLALHYYHDEYGRFPPAFVADQQGKPLYSWRVLILPYLESQELYQQFDLTQAWDSAANEALIHEMPEVFASPYAREKAAIGETSYLALVDVFNGQTVLRPGQSRSLGEIPDGASNTAMVVSCPQVFAIWTQPIDLDPLEYLTTAGNGLPFEEVRESIAHLRADGSVGRHATDDRKSLIPWVLCDDGRIPLD